MTSYYSAKKHLRSHAGGRVRALRRTAAIVNSGHLTVLTSPSEIGRRRDRLSIWDALVRRGASSRVRESPRGARRGSDLRVGRRGASPAGRVAGCAPAVLDLVTGNLVSRRQLRVYVAGSRLCPVASLDSGHRMRVGDELR